MIKEIDIIVVNWNCGTLTSVAIAPYINFRANGIACNVIVVDNASQDESVALLQKLPIRLIANKVNKGFGHACNQAFEQSDANYILLLNPDTESDPATLVGLVDFLEKHEGYAVAGPKQENEKGEVVRSCGRFPVFRTALFDVLSLSKLFPRHFTPTPIMTDWDHLQSSDVDHIMGSYMLIKKQVIDITGFMDKAYFVYWEDIDLSKRIALAGFKSYFNNEFTIFHKGGASGDKVVMLRLFYSISARRIYWKKHLSKPALYILTSLSLIIEPWLRVVNSLITTRGSDTGSILKAYIMYTRHLLNGGRY